MAKYGCPYMGSKGKIAEQILRCLPPAENFYDLFGGGFSISHCALVKFKKWNNIHYNEINADIVDLVNRSIAGEYSYVNFKPEWISKEDFSRLKDTDAYVRCIWSFGNNQKNYLFGKDIEEYKRSMHMAVVFNDFDKQAKEILGIERFSDKFTDITKRRLFLRSRITKLKGNDKQLQQLQQLERLQQLEQLQRLEQRLNTYSMSYELVPIKENSVIYCDIPYKDTATYLNEFDHDKFYDWAHNQKNPVFISEYNVDDKRFFKIADISKLSLMSAKKERTEKHEVVFANQAGKNLIWKKNQ